MKQQMKRMTFIAGALMALMTFMALNVAAQDNMMKHDKMAGEKMMIDHSKPTVAIIRADWCTACQKLEPTMSELISQYKDRLNFVMLDVTTDEKTAESVNTAQELGIAKFFQANKKNTSTVIVLGEKNKILFKTTHNFDRDAYVRAFDDAVAKNSMMMKKHG
ncbi:MAG: thioredoxin domain-containing protein [Pyrinomonadaceae bacterium]